MKLFGPVIINTNEKGTELLSIFKKCEYKPLSFDAMCLNSPHASRLASHIKVLRMLPDGFDAIWICEDNCVFSGDTKGLRNTIEKFGSSSADGIYLGFNELKAIDYDENFKQLFGSSLVNSYIVKRSVVDDLIIVYGAAYRAIITEQPNVFLTAYKNLELPQRALDMNNVERSIHTLMDKTCWLIPKTPFFVPSVQISNK
jgi:hypothetical protein